jgi:hypothetical protein
MSHHPGSHLVGILLIAGSFVCTRAGGEVNPPPPEPIHFEFIDRIRAAESSQAWRQKGWKAPTIEAGLERLVKTVRTATGDEFRQLPVDFNDVSAESDERQAGITGGLLRVYSGNANLAFAKKSIFLVDGNIHISHLADSIVIARGIVEISHGNRNVVIAGHHAQISHDGGDAFRDGARPGVVDPPMKHGSIVVSGGSVSIGHAQGTACWAPQHLDISHATQVDYLGSPKRTVSHQHGCREHKNFVLPISVGVPTPFPSDVLTIKQIVAPDDRTKQLVTVERNGIEYVLRPGGRITDEMRRPIPEFTNWTLGFLTSNVVLFTDGKNDMSIRIE